MKTYFNTTKILRHFYPKPLVWDIKNQDKKIYLTFDDGPTQKVTDALLDILKKYDAKATFFCIGKNVVAQPDLFERIKAEGHAIGNHTWDHLNAQEVNTSAYLESIEKTKNIFESKLFRPPYGRIKSDQADAISNEYKIIMWSVLSGDFDLKKNAKACLKTVVRDTKPGSIIVFHDSVKAASKMLFSVPKVIEHFQVKGFEFAAIDDEMLKK